MSKESFDLDSLIELENEFVDLNESEREIKTKKKKKKEKEKKELEKSGKRSVLNILLTSVLPVVVVAPLAFLTGSMLSTDVQPEVTTIKQIKAESSLKSRVDSIKDSEIQALQSQLVTLTDSYKIDDISSESISINKTINKDIVLLEQFMTELLNDDGSKDRTSIKTRVQQFFTSDELKENEFGKFTNEQLEILDAIELSTENSFSIEKNQSTAKIGTSIISALTSGKGSSKIYQVISPLTTSNGEIYSVIYFVKINGVNVVSASYAGYIEGLDNSKEYFEAMTNVVSELRNRNEDDATVQINDKSQLPSKENRETEEDVSDESTSEEESDHNSDNDE